MNDVLFIWILMAIATGAMAQRRGRSGPWWVVWGLFTGPIAFIAAIFLMLFARK